jgi:glycosyltransferase involved in cell wall biosynthesis
MKVIYLHQFFNTPSMSGGVRSYDIAHYLVENGHTVHMITSMRDLSDKDRWSFTNENGINVHWLSMSYSNKFSFLKRLKAFFLFAVYSAKKGSSLDGDIIYASSAPLTIAIPALYISWKKSIPIVFEVRDLWPAVPIAMGVLKNPFLKYLAKNLEKYIYKKSKAVIALSEGMKNGVVDAGYDENKVFVIPNFSNNEMFNSDLTGGKFQVKRKWLKNSPLLVYTGTFGLVNGVSFLVDIAEQLIFLNSNVKILLLGHGIEFESVKSYAIEKNVLNTNLFIEPSINKEELPEVLSAASLASNLVIDVPELWNNSANKFFDALASGTPVLINGSGWQADLINKTNTGIVTYGLSIEQSAKAVNDFLNNEDLLKESSINALNLSKEFFDKDKLVMQVEEVLYLSLKQECKKPSKVHKND